MQHGVFFKYSLVFVFSKLGNLLCKCENKKVQFVK